jgi:putative acyl-CoA dehydrogenase
MFTEDPSMNAAAADASVTHEVLNQATPLAGYNAFTGDAALVETVMREGGGWAADDLARFGAAITTAEVQDWARLANRHTPELRSHDRFGHRIDFVEYHPAYHDLMRLAFGAGVHSYAWLNDRPGAHVARAGLSYLWNQAENGTACPTGMNYSAVPAIAAVPALGEAWVPKINATAYDPRPLPLADKPAATIGMTLTEKQGGSDLRANTTQARPLEGGGVGTAYELTGHKWFCSAPMCDAFYTTAYTEAGPTCFLVPRSLPDGSRNRFFIQRLKDKLGNRSNASSEIEYRGTLAWALCEEGRGIRTAIEMIALTRLDFAVGSAGLMRRALTEALHHARGRRAFQRHLVDQPLMRAVLADLAVESEACMALAFRMARATDEGLRGDTTAAAFARLGTAVAKYWNCKRASGFVHEALECHGGNGFVEEHVLARLYREAPLNSIWEGAGNVMVLDVLRALRREPETLDAVLAELHAAKGADRRLDDHVTRLTGPLAGDDLESQGRCLVEALALAMQGALLVRHAAPAVADAFCASRLGGEGGRFFGALSVKADLAAIVERATVAS